MREEEKKKVKLILKTGDKEAIQTALLEYFRTFMKPEHSLVDTLVGDLDGELPILTHK